MKNRSKARFLSKLGVTRVADLTDLDRIGVPVFSAVRPNSRSLSVTAGKGLTRKHAWLSAVMEAAEQFHAEDFGYLRPLVESASWMKRHGKQIIDLSRQSRCNSTLLNDQTKLAWVPGFNIRTLKRIYAPYELVGLDMTARSPWRTDVFRFSSLGLAAGTNRNAAILHAIEELCEDDALFTVVKLGKSFDRESSRLKVSSNSEFSNLCRLVKSKGFRIRFCDATSVLQYPVVACRLTDETNQQNPDFMGFGSKSSKEEAASAALLEAIQSRLTYISGARDDLTSDRYNGGDGATLERLFSDIKFTRGHIRVKLRKRRPESKVKFALETLALAGLGDAYAFPLNRKGGQYCVVRVLVDDMVSHAIPPNAAYGKRAASKILVSLVR